MFWDTEMDKMSPQHKETQVQYELRKKEKEIVFSILLICFYPFFVFLKKKSCSEFPRYRIT